METVGWWWLTKGKVIARDDCLCGVQNKKTTLQVERPNLNLKWCKALLSLSAQVETGKCDGITACYAVRIVLFVSCV